MIRKPAAGLAVVLGTLLCTSPARSDDPVSSSVRYTGEIVRIFDRKCAPCHRRDGLAMPLTNYRELRDWSRAIREEIVEQRMPPWIAARGYARFRDDLALTAREATTILSWLDGGMPRGDDRDLPPASSDGAPAEPDLHLTIAPQRVPPLDEHVVRRVGVETGLDRERTLERVVVNPGQRSVLRGALVFAGDPGNGGRLVGAWLPWQHQIEAPDGGAITLQPRTPLIVELHYRGGQQEVRDSPTIDLFFDEGAVRQQRGVQHDDLVLRAGMPIQLAARTAIWAIVPSADASTTSLELTARRPNGAVAAVLWIPNSRREWPQVLALRAAMTVPAGTTLTLSVEPASAVATARLSRIPSPPS
jgi:hypothetical protein